MRCGTGDSRGSRLRIGTSTGLGDQLDAVLHAVRAEHPDIAFELDGGSREMRLRKVASGALDAAFFRGRIPEEDLHPGVGQLKAWDDELVVALPDSTEYDSPVSLAALRDIPLQLVVREANPTLHEVVLAACSRAGFTPAVRAVAANPTGSLAMISAGPLSWTVLYAAHARTVRPPGVRFLATVETLAVPTYVVTAPAPTPAVAALVRAVRRLR